MKKIVTVLFLSLVLNTSVFSRDYGRNMFYLEPGALPVFGYVGVGYEHFSSSGVWSMQVPLRVQVLESDVILFGNTGAESDDFGIDEAYIAGFKHKFFPTLHHDGVAKGFIGYAHHVGYLSTRYKDYYSYQSGWTTYYEDRWVYNEYMYQDFMLVGGLQLHAGSVVNMTIEADVGIAILDFEDVAFATNLLFNLGFRF